MKVNQVLARFQHDCSWLLNIAILVGSCRDCGCLVVVYKNAASAWSGPAAIHWAWRILDMKYGCDEFNQLVFANGTRSLGGICWQMIDVRVIDDGIVNGLSQTVRKISERIRHIQSGFVYHYAFTMIIGLFLLITWFVAN